MVANLIKSFINIKGYELQDCCSATVLQAHLLFLLIAIGFSPPLIHIFRSYLLMA